MLPLPPPLPAPSPPTPTPAARPLSADDAVMEIPEKLAREWWRDSALLLLPAVLGGFGDDEEEHSAVRWMRAVRCWTSVGRRFAFWLFIGKKRRQGEESFEMGIWAHGLLVMCRVTIKHWQ